jgi:hypothetical protein
MLRTLLLFFGPLLALVAVSQASAQSPITSSETFKTIIGKWEMSNADRDRTCQLTFKADPSGALFKLDLDKACTAQMPELKDVVGWTIGGLDLVKLMDSKGKALFEFSVNPGWVKTDMGGPGAPLTPSESVAALKRLIATLGLAQSGKFFNYDGREYPW